MNRRRFLGQGEFQHGTGRHRAAPQRENGPVLPKRAVLTVRTVAVRPSRINGVGCFAISAFEAGTPIAEYRGEVITESEALRRDDPSYHGYSPFIVHMKARRFIDGAVGGNEIRFLNHSCDANCDLVLLDGRLFVAAGRQIARREELTIDYAFDRGRGFTCNCGAPTCRGSPFLAKREDKC